MSAEVIVHDPDGSVEVIATATEDTANITVEETPPPAVVEVHQGPPGPPGSGQPVVHVRDIPSDTWEVTHNLGKKPVVVVVDSSGRVVLGAVKYLDDNRVEVTFRSPFGGTAYLT